ncbi:tyrosine-type recombinase/integrase [Mycobacterium sp. 155]|uniref:tyrosine-type recombinase/integrase n=1 Tax=Mycobacterium sp. 155 TaxID=1157943 RepID=UPI00036BC000|nr:tyrosine-type recombinase/integrase [Mycobacterium sp. 155]
MASTGARDFGTIRRLPSGKYQARYRAPDGERRTAPTTFTTKKAASAWLADIQSDIERDRWKSPEQVASEEAAATAARAEVMTVSQLAEIWLETIPSENHRVISISRVRRFINPELGHIKLDELTKERCDQWYRDMQTTLCPGAPTQVRRTFAALHAMLKLAVNEDWIGRSPLRIKGALIDTPTREPQTASAAEVDQLAAAMPPELSMFPQISAWTGLRLGEVNGLQIGDISVDRSTPCPLLPVVRIQIRRHVVAGRGTGSMTIVPGSKATGRTESVVVPPHLHVPLWLHVEKYARKTNPQWLFPGTRTVDMPVGPATVDRRWRLAREACDLEHLVFHDLRRTSSTTAAMAGATVGELKERLRHRTSEAAERYIVAARGADADLAHRMSQHAANPHRVAPRTETVTEDVTRLGTGDIDTVMDAVADLIERVQTAGDEEMIAYLGERLAEVRAVASGE